MISLCGSALYKLASREEVDLESPEWDSKHRV